MSGPRKPRDLDKFMSVKDSANWLRRFANEVERNELPTSVLSISITIRRWDDSWNKLRTPVANAPQA